MGQLILWTTITVVAVLVAKWFINKDGHPKALFYLFFAEMWERFSYYGMRALLILYLTKHFLFDDVKAGMIYGSYVALIYGLPLLGGIIADRYLGMKKSVTFGAVLLVLGHLSMAIEGDPAVMEGNTVYRSDVHLNFSQINFLIDYFKF